MIVNELFDLMSVPLNSLIGKKVSKSDLNNIQFNSTFLEETSNGKDEKLLDLSIFCKKLLTHSEQFELTRVYNILAKIKNTLRFRMLGTEHLFLTDQEEFQGRTLQSLSISIPSFHRSIRELKIQGLQPRDVDILSYFLSTIDNEGGSCISYTTITSYFRKIDLKYQYFHLVDFKNIYEECQKILAKKEEFLRKWQKICKKELIGYSEMRVLLSYFEINEDVIDLLLLKFVEAETSSILFFNKIESFCKLNGFLNKKESLNL